MRYPRFALVAVFAFICAPTAWGQPQGELVLHFIEIGQGDCTLIECPNGGFILVGATDKAVSLQGPEQDDNTKGSKFKSIRDAINKPTGGYKALVGV